MPSAASSRNTTTWRRPPRKFASNCPKAAIARLSSPGPIRLRKPSDRFRRRSPCPCEYRGNPGFRGWSPLHGARALAGALAVRLAQPDPIDPLVRAAWGPVLRHGADVLVLLSAPPLLRTIPSQPGARPESNVLEPAPEWAARWYSDLNLNNLGGPVFLSPTRGYSVFSDAFTAMSVSSLLALAGSTYHAMPEYAVQPRGIHETGLVVIGAPAYTRFLARILQTTPYSIWWDPVANDEVLGLKSGGGGPPYIAKRDPQLHRYTKVYGLITVLPSQPGQSRPNGC